jgi:hypothetical protein
VIRPAELKIVNIAYTKYSFIMIGAAPATGDQSSTDGWGTCGLYLHAHDGNKRGEGRVDAAYHGARVYPDSTVGVVVDAARNISFIVDGVDRQVAFAAPAERGPLRLAVLLWQPKDRVQLVQ